MSGVDAVVDEVLQEHLREIAETTRSLYNAVLTEALGSTETRGTCLYGAILLCESFNRMARGVSAIVRGGDGAGDGGFVAQDGVARGHYWVEVATRAGAFICDITADQFGDAACKIVRSTDAEGQRYRAGDQALVNDHVAEAMDGMRLAATSI